MARRYGFRYETLLRIRLREEEERARNLSVAVGELQTAERQREATLEEQRQVLRSAGERARERFDARDLGLYYQYERHLARQAVVKAAQVVDLKEGVAEKQSEFEEAVKQRRIVDTLKERSDRAYRAAVAMEERKAMDDVAAIRAASRGRRARGTS